MHYLTDSAKILLQAIIDAEYLTATQQFSIRELSQKDVLIARRELEDNAFIEPRKYKHPRNRGRVATRYYPTQKGYLASGQDIPDHCIDRSSVYDNDTKRYLSLIEKQSFDVPGNGWAISMPADSPEPKELYEICSLDYSRQILVERSNLCNLLETKWPSSYVFPGDIVDALNTVSDNIAYLHADYLGCFNQTTISTISQALSKSSPEGCWLRFTHTASGYRGNDRNVQKWWLGVYQVLFSLHRRDILTLSQLECFILDLESFHLHSAVMCWAQMVCNLFDSELGVEPKGVFDYDGVGDVNMETCWFRIFPSDQKLTWPVTSLVRLMELLATSSLNVNT